MADDKPKDIILYRGQPISELSREELEVAFGEVVNLYHSTVQTAMRSLDLLSQARSRKIG